MTTQEPTPPPGVTEGRSRTYRGGSVDVDARRLVRVLLAILLVGLAALTVFLVVVGLHHNSQINRLRQHGVTVQVTVSGCEGLLGGSGSNAAGYSCRGTFTLSGHTYNESLPGSTLHHPGAIIREVTVPGDPALLSTVHSVATDHTSAGVFIVPAILLVVLLLLVGFLVLRRRRHAEASPPPPTTNSP
jgi:MYXO-CTERM domain-containing protein